MPKAPKRPRDPNQLAKLIVDLATGEATDPDPGADTAGQQLGRLGGSARARALTPERRAEIAKKAAQARWKTSRTSQGKKEPA